MLEIVTLSPADGWAVVREGANLMLVRPPYRRMDQRIVDDDFVERTLVRLGFLPAAAPRAFSGWESLIRHLNEQVAATRAGLGHDINDPSIGERILQMLPESVLRAYLELVRSEMLPNPATWDGAKRLLLAILKASQVREAPGLHEEAVGLLQRLSEEQGERQFHDGGPRRI
jgi:hypothetical protein